MSKARELLIVVISLSMRWVNRSSGMMAAILIAITRCPHPLRVSGTYGPTTSAPKALPVSTPESTSIMNEIAYPLCPDIGRISPSSAACGSLVGKPEASIAQPSGRRSPRSLAA